jgi:hypothetical protein
MIKGVLIVNESGKCRLSKFYEDIVLFYFFKKKGTFTTSQSSERSLLACSQKIKRSL